MQHSNPIRNVSDALEEFNVLLKEVEQSMDCFEAATTFLKFRTVIKNMQFAARLSNKTNRHYNRRLKIFHPQIRKQWQ